MRVLFSMGLKETDAVIWNPQFFGLLAILCLPTNQAAKPAVIEPVVTRATAELRLPDEKAHALARLLKEHMPHKVAITVHKEATGKVAILKIQGEAEVVTTVSLFAELLAGGRPRLQAEGKFREFLRTATPAQLGIQPLRARKPSASTR